MRQRALTHVLSHTSETSRPAHAILATSRARDAEQLEMVDALNVLSDTSEVD